MNAIKRCLLVEVAADFVGPLLCLFALAIIVPNAIVIGDDVDLIAIGSISGAAIDASGLDGKLEDGTPHNQLGGFSALEYSGEDSLYFVLPDRGPKDGAVAYACRIHTMQLTIDASRRSLDAKLSSTILLKKAERENLVGSLSSLGNRRLDRGRALDPEGLRLDAEGSFLVSDEYGPDILRFAPNGLLLETLDRPSAMGLTREPNLAEAKIGAMPNRGLEGLAISIDKTTLFAAMQGPLVQDSFSEGDKRFSRWTRIIRMDLATKQVSASFLYPLDDFKTGLSEILAVDGDRFLVIERDGESRNEAKTKRIYLVDLCHATDVGIDKKLPSRKLPIDCIVAEKKLLIDLLDPKWRIPSQYSLEKPEGLAWGPIDNYGSKTLIVCFDNDFQTEVPTLLLAFRMAIQ